MPFDDALAIGSLQLLVAAGSLEAQDFQVAGGGAKPARPAADGHTAALHPCWWASGGTDSSSAPEATGRKCAPQHALHSR